MQHRHHAIDYIELSVDDVTAAKAFYSDAFGWSFNDYGLEYAGIIDPRGGEIGGLTRVDSVSRGGPCVLLFSEDLETTREAVTAAGGTTREPYDFPGGRRFHFTDPFGNELGVWAQPAT